MKKIYVADDDSNICELIKEHLENAGYEVRTFLNGKDLLKTYQEIPCDLIITDITMPEMNGYDLCKEIRKTSNVPIYMISANNEEIDRVLGLELGSDDYIGKPIRFRELLIKIKNTFKRLDSYQSVTPLNMITILDVNLNTDRREVSVEDSVIELTPKEYELLKLFMENPKLSFSRDHIIERIWGYEYYGDTRQVDDLVKRVRKKLLKAGSIMEIQTVWGFGYKLGGTT